MLVLPSLEFVLLIDFVAGVASNVVGSMKPGCSSGYLIHLRPERNRTHCPKGDSLKTVTILKTGVVLVVTLKLRR